MAEALEERLMLSTIFVNNTNDAGTGSLRAAILMANDLAAGIDKISFAIPGTGVQTITPLSPLPAITNPVTIDGYSQPGATANTNGPGLADNAVLLIELRGGSTGLGFGNLGLVLSAGKSTIQGLVIDSFYSGGIVLNTKGGDVIAGDYIGVDPTGTNALANLGAAILIDGTSGNTIGGTSAGARNVISGNGDGLEIEGKTASGNLVAGNLLGTSATGGLLASNGRPSSHGISLDDALRQHHWRHHAAGKERHRRLFDWHRHRRPRRIGKPGFGKLHRHRRHGKERHPDGVWDCHRTHRLIQHDRR